MLALERRKILLLFRASFFCPNVAFCSMSKAFVVVPTVSDNLVVYSSDEDGKNLYEKILNCKILVSYRETENYRVLKS